jgi:hypothetical protein
VVVVEPAEQAGLAQSIKVFLDLTELETFQLVVVVLEQQVQSVVVEPIQQQEQLELVELV